MSNGNTGKGKPEELKVFKILVHAAMQNKLEKGAITAAAPGTSMQIRKAAKKLTEQEETVSCLHVNHPLFINWLNKYRSYEPPKTKTGVSARDGKLLKGEAPKFKRKGDKPKKWE